MPTFDAPILADGLTLRPWTTSAASNSTIVTASANGSDTDVATTAMMTSSDATVWNHVVDIPDVRLYSVVAAGPGFVAVGHKVTQPGFFPPRVPAVFTSFDGLTWTPTTSIDFSPFTFGEMNRVAVTGSGLIASGSASSPGGPVHPAVWTSPDGLTWNIATPFGSIDNDVGTNVAVGAGGIVVNVSVFGESSVSAVHTWWSPDGRSWTPTPDPAPIVPGITRAGQLAAFHAGFVVIGADTAVGTGPIVWTSPDGQTWNGPDPLPVRPVTDSSFARGFTTDGALLLAVGDDVEFGEGAGPAVNGASIWMSLNAIDWIQVPPAALDGAVILDAVTAEDAFRFGDGWIVLGTTWEHGEGHRASVVWRSVVE